MLQAVLLASAVDGRLLAYQQRYSVCHGKTNYQIAECLINGDLDFSRFRGDRSIFLHISRKKIAEVVQQGKAYEFTMAQMPKTRRYIGLLEYIDYLYSIKDVYVTPRFKGNEAEDIIRTKQVLNLLQLEELELTPEYTPEFEAAILEFQRRHGLAVDGKIGPQTKRELKKPLSKIITRIKKNLTIERLSLPKPPTYILVNIPEFMMHFYRDGVQVLQMKTVVGKPKMRTPLFHRKMKFIVLNPTWNVPPSIYAKEYAHKSPEQLRRLGLRYNSEGKLYQPSGKRNALGLVKFLFPNRFNVYMHDTPAKSLFRRTRRAFSHGCIRLERPMDLLHELGYEYRPGKTRWITLEEQIPVYIEYHTVWVDDEGVVQFRPDVYGYEWKLFGK
jgi:murein L,D-transpeptidase YcbB/YkuD